MIRPLGAALLLLAWCGASCTAEREDPVLKPFGTIRSGLDSRAQAALHQMNGLGLQLLATRSYLRAGSSLGERWSWTQAEIAAWPGTAAQIAFDDEINKVRLVFERSNPGYSLFVTGEVRTLDLQLQRWNQNSSVAEASANMLADVQTAIQQPDFPAPGSPGAVTKLRELIRDHEPQPVPTLAAPGLSAHGRMFAVDFQVRQGSRTVAGPDSRQIESVWIAQGWDNRLQAAVQASGARFTGPLSNPVEPWHYDYQP